MNEKKVVSIEDRIPKLKQARKKKSNRRLIFYISVFFVLISIVIYLQSPLSHIHTIEISGNHYISEQEIHRLSGITEGDNFWRVNQEKAEKQIAEHPEVKAVQVSKNFPTKVSIGIEELHRVGYIHEDQWFYPLLENGERLNTEPLETSAGDAPLLFGFDQQIYLEELSKELTKLPSSIVDLISEINWMPTEGNPYKLLLYMNDGFEVETSIRSFSSTMKTYPSITAQLDPDTKGVIRLDVSGAVFAPYVEQTTENSITEEIGES